MYWGFYLDPLYLLLLIAVLVISGGSQLYIRKTFARWNAQPNGNRLTGMQVGQTLVDRIRFGSATGSATGIRFKEVPGDLSDHFDPRTREIGLSATVGRTASVAAMAVVAHEVGHAQQHAEDTVAMKARSFLVPALAVSPTLSYLCIVFGLIFNIAGLFYLGILFFGVMVVFTLLTLPVELGASRRAVVMLRDARLLSSPQEESAVKEVLRAAALTYVAAAVTSILQLLYYLSIANRRR
ncbi:MAG: zinc metallopeptidase [Chloroflexota bacterium]